MWNIISNSARSSLATWFKLLKILIPITVIVKTCMEYGVIEYLSPILSPIMSLLGLPPVAAVVWATAMISNLWGGVIILGTIGSATDFTVAQATILAIIMLMTHALPIELKIASKCGVNIFFALCLRLLNSFTLGFIFYAVFKQFDLLSGPAHISLNQTQQITLTAWATNQAYSYLIILAALFGLVFSIELSRSKGWIAFAESFMEPSLRIIGISRKATAINIIGIFLGLNYGGALLLREIDEGDISQDDKVLSVTLMSTIHSIFSDTIIMLMIGSSFFWIFLVRISYCYLFMWLFSKIYHKRKDKLFPIMTNTNA